MIRDIPARLIEPATYLMERVWRRRKGIVVSISRSGRLHSGAKKIKPEAA
jgi:hypothetical protein